MASAAKLAARAAAVAGSLLLSTAVLAQQAAPTAVPPSTPAARPAAAAPAAVPNTVVPIGYAELSLDADPRWDPTYARYEVPTRPWGSAYAGAVMAVNDNAPTAKFTHIDYVLKQATADSIDELITAVKGMVQGGVHFVVVDLPAADLLKLSDAVTSLPVTLFNISAHEDSLRGADCRFNMVHVAPSYRQLTDGIVQFMVLRRWKNILVLQGPDPRDKAVADAISVSASQFGARIVAVRPFVYGTNPTNRETNNVSLITGGVDYDVVYIADADGEFARNAQYNTNSPRPVIGSSGLIAVAYWWGAEDQDARQINQRFFDIAKRKIDPVGWGAWTAVRTIAAAVLRSKSTDYQPVMDFMLSDKLTVDGAKKNPMSVRPWDHQMRQSILLASGNAVLWEAPVAGFLHATNNLDTLGVDQPNTTCKFPRK
jgi:ABC transporter substrate binding protein (PQQ-dependent alcohol dehydrogenase system)